MFNLQGSELIIILLLALVVLGPEKLPDAMRRAGRFYAELRKMSSTFQEEFKSVIDEPVREVRDTANLLRDSADFRSLQDGERTEKPKSAEMVAPADPDAVPTDAVPTFEPSDEAAPAETTEATDAHEVSPADERADAPAPFSGSQRSSAAPPVRSDAPPAADTDGEDGASAGQDTEAGPSEDSEPPG